MVGGVKGIQREAGGEENGGGKLHCCLSINIPRSPCLMLL